MGKIVDFKKGAEDIASEWAVPVFAFLLFLLLVALVSVMFSDCTAKWVGELLGTKGNNSKTTTIQLLGWIMSGVLVVIGLVFLNRRAEAQMRAAEAQTDVAKSQVENNRLVEKGHTQERFKTAAEHLGHDNASVRIAAFYEFVHLANEHKEEYQKSILEILYAHIRTTTTNSAYSEEAPESDKPKPTEEIQGLLDVLFKFKEIDRGDTKPNLQRVYLPGADLSRGDLSGADLSKGDLSRASFYETDLSGASFSRANLSGARLSKADLSGARLSRASLFGARLSRTNLSRANLSKVNLSEARLSRADLSGARLSEANLFGADLSEANLSGANLYKADLSGVIWYGANLSEAKLYNTDLSGANLLGVNLSGAKLSETNLSGADLSGADLSDVEPYKINLSGADLSGANLSDADLSDADLSKVRLGGASYTNETRFPEWLELPAFVLDNDDNMKIPEGFVAPEKPKDDE